MHSGRLCVSTSPSRARRPGSPDGKTIVYTGPDGGVYIARAAGGNGRMLSHGYLADWSTSGGQIVYTRMGDTYAQDSVWIMNRDGSKPTAS
jgi:hypothetical protein